MDQVFAGTKPRLTLCSPCVPGSKRRDAALDAEVDALVVAGLEMQAVVLLARAPVAAVQRLGAPEEHGGRDGLAVVARALDHEVLAQRLRQRAEERARQVRLVAVPQEGVAMQVVDLVDGTADRARCLTRFRR